MVERARTILASEPSSDIAFVTFTRTSRRDTNRKVEEVLAETQKRQTKDLPRVSTLHGFAKSIVHKMPTVVGLNEGFCVLLPEKEQGLILEEVREDLSLEISTAALRRAIATKKNTGAVEVSVGQDPAELLKAADRYEALCCFYNATDIEGLVCAATKIIKDAKPKLPFLYLHVDEYQDLNHADQEFVRTLLAVGPHDVVVVGDDD